MTLQRVETTVDIRLAEVIATLSLATDLGMGQPLQHALRSCVVAVRLGDALGLSEQELGDVYYLALLRAAGCTADASITAAVFGDEIAARTWLATLDFGRPTEMVGALLRYVGAGEPPLRRTRMLITAFTTLPQLPEIEAGHCEVAQQLAGRLAVGAGVQRALGHIFERWDGRGLPRHVKGDDVALPARVVAVAHDATLFFRLGGLEAAVGVVQKRRGGAYDPWVAEHFCRQAQRLLAHSETESVWEAVLAAEPGPRPQLSQEQFGAALRAMADFADLQCPYTGNHSSGVAALAAAAAEECKLPEREVTAVRQAGLLHDLGRVGVPAGIWNLPRRLTDEEWEHVRLHPYYTERVLSRSAVFESLGTLAAMHHERLDGSGYHRCLPLAMQPAPARILAAADAYHAMTEPRPHRPALTPEAAADEVRREVKAGRLDREAVNAVLSAAGHRVRSTRRSWPAGLTEREVEVLRLVARGLSNREMAGTLSVSASTVHHHIQHIYDKVGVSTRAAATLFALQHDLLGTDISNAS